MPKLFDRVKVNIATTGTGTVTFGPASSPAFLTPSEAGAVDGNTVRYAIVDGTDFEEGVGTILASVAQMARTTVTRSKIGGVIDAVKINLSGTAVLVFTAGAADILNPANNLSDLASAATARSSLGLGSAATQASSAFLQSGNNLSEVGSAATARSNLGLGVSANPQFAGVELGHASDTTVSRSAAGRMQVESEEVLTTKDLSSVLSSAQKKQARENIGVKKKNYILNGAMMVSQENGSNTGTTSGYYPVDQFFMSSATGGSFQIARLSTATPSGSLFRIGVVVTLPDTSISATETQGIIHNIEGVNFANLLYGSSSAKASTLRFGVNAPAGTYSVSIRNPSASRTYIAEYVISVGEAGTDVYRSIVVPGDQTGTWPKDNQSGVSICWTLVCGATYQAAPGSWYANNYVGSTNQTNFMGTNGAAFQLFDVGLYEGSVAPDFVVPELSETLRRCQRYWEYVTFGGLYFPNPSPGSTLYAPIHFLDKRLSSPALTLISSISGICWANTGSNVTPLSFTLSATSSKSGRVNAVLATNAMGGILPFDFTVNARL